MIRAVIHKECMTCKPIRRSVCNIPGDHSLKCPCIDCLVKGICSQSCDPYLKYAYEIAKMRRKGGLIKMQKHDMKIERS